MSNKKYDCLSKNYVKWINKQLKPTNKVSKSQNILKLMIKYVLLISFFI